MKKENKIYLKGFAWGSICMALSFTTGLNRDSICNTVFGEDCSQVVQENLDSFAGKSLAQKALGYKGNAYECRCTDDPVFYRKGSVSGVILRDSRNCLIHNDEIEESERTTGYVEITDPGLTHCADNEQP